MAQGGSGPDQHGPGLVGWEVDGLSTIPTQLLESLIVSVAYAALATTTGTRDRVVDHGRYG
jgi:hypothetical protein